MVTFTETAPAPSTVGDLVVTQQQGHRGAIAVLMGLFFAIGFLTCLNDIVIPHFKAAFVLDYEHAMLVNSAFFAAYFVVSPPSGLAVRKLGYKKAILLGLGVASLGCFLFYPAAILLSYPLFLGALFVLASGFTLLQVAVNPYAAILGSPETASSRLTLAQAFNSFGTTIAPWIGSMLIFSGASATTLQGIDRSEAARSVQGPYLAFAAILAVMCGLLALFRLPDARPDGPVRQGASVWTHAPLVFGALGIFVYVGAEVSIGSILVNFMKEPSIGALDETSAAHYLTYYWGGAMVGRFVGSAVLRTLPPSRVLATFAGIAFALVGATILFTGHTAMITILAVGLFNSIMFPTIFTLAIDGLGERTGDGSGVLCMAIVGGAIVPWLEGKLADRVGIHTAFLVPLLCYAYIVWYGFAGSKMRFRAAESAEPRRAA